MILIDIFTFLAHLHPLVVHLPIGFLLLALIFQLLSGFETFQNLKAAVPVSLLLGFVAAVLACDFGYLLSLNGDYDPEILLAHKASGIILAAISGILFLMTTKRFQAFYKVPSKIFSGLLIGLFVLVSYSGHQGGTLTHGRGYLTVKTLTEQKRAKPVSVEQAFIFEDVVHPILKNKCAQCHQDGKLKGSLSVENLQLLLKGGKSGSTIVAGKAAESELFKRIMLDPAHEDFMPADGKTPLTKSEAEIIGWWIDKALAMEGKQIAQIKGNETIRPQVASYLRLGNKMASEETVGIAQQINPDIPVNLNRTLVENLRKEGFMVRVMLQKPVMLDVTLPSGSKIKLADVQDHLIPLAKNIIWLNLSDNGFTEKDLGFLKLLVNLEKLRLEKNPIGDDITHHLSLLKHLVAVNLSGTKISRSGLEKLALHTGIKRIYTWNTPAEL